MAVLLIIAIVPIIAYFLYNFVTTAHSYWAKKGIKGPKPHPIYGNLQSVLVTNEDNINTLADKIYKDYPNESVIGIYQGLMPTLIVKDQDLIKDVLIKDFSHFVNRGGLAANDAISKNILTAEGDYWKALRHKFSPAFSTGKLKGMMPLIDSCVGQYMDHLNAIVDNKSPKDIRNLMMKFTMKTITSIGFGIDVNTFTEPPTEFEVMADKLFKPKGIRRLVFLLNFFLPELVNYLHLKWMDPEVVNFFLKLVKEIVEAREGKPKIRKDFMDLMIELKEEGTVKLGKGKETELEITHEVITAQAIVFYAAGFETSSGTMAFLLYELAKNPEIQECCREEVDKVMKKYNGKLDYDGLKDLEYLSKALDEAMRMYPVVSILFRQCVEKEYTFSKINLKIDKGTRILVPVRTIHMDPKHFPDPETFNPDRSLQDNKYYMPFGDGPRICIGNRLARVQTLLVVANFLHRFKVRTCKETPKQITVDIRQGSLCPLEEIRLNIERRLDHIGT